MKKKYIYIYIVYDGPGISERHYYVCSQCAWLGKRVIECRAVDHHLKGLFTVLISELRFPGTPPVVLQSAGSPGCEVRLVPAVYCHWDRCARRWAEQAESLLGRWDWEDERRSVKQTLIHVISACGLVSLAIVNGTRYFNSGIKKCNHLFCIYDNPSLCLP